MERVDRLPSSRSRRSRSAGGLERRATFRLSLIAVGAVAVTALALHALDDGHAEERFGEHGRRAGARAGGGGPADRRTSTRTSRRARTRSSPPSRSRARRRRRRRWTPRPAPTASPGSSWARTTSAGASTDVRRGSQHAQRGLRGRLGRRRLEDHGRRRRTGPTCGRTRYTQTMGALAQAPNGDLWAGTGEANPPGGGLTYFGDGIYKSTDNGGHWTNMGLRRQRGDRADRGRSDATRSGCSSPPPGHIARTRAGPRPVPHARRRQDVAARARAAERDDRRDRRRDQPDRTRRSSTRRCGITRATTAARFYGGVGSGLFRSKDGGDTWERLENIVDPLPAYDTRADRPEAGPDASAASASRSRRSNPNRMYVVFGDHTGPDKGSYCSDDGGDTFHADGPRLPGVRRLSVVVRARLGRPGRSEPPLQRRRAPAHVDRRRHDVDRDQRAALRPARHGLGSVTLDGNPATPPRLPRQRRRHVPLRRQRRQRLRGCKATNQPWNQTLPPRDLRAGPAAHDDRPAGQRLGRSRGRRRRAPSRRSRSATLDELEHLGRR